MQKELKQFADMVRPLRLKEKARFLYKIKNYAALFDPQNPQDTPECLIDKRTAFAGRFRQVIFDCLRGHYYSIPKYNGAFLSEKEKKEQLKDDLYMERISEGLRAYTYASLKERIQFERRVKSPRLFESFFRKKHIWEYNFR